MAEVALAAIPENFQQQLTNTLIVVDDLPDLDAVREGEDPDLLGLYEGATALEHGCRSGSCSTSATTRTSWRASGS